MATVAFPSLIVMGRLPSDTRDTASSVLSFQLGPYYETRSKGAIYAATRRMAREINTHGAPRIRALISSKRLTADGSNNPDARPASGFGVTISWPGGRTSTIR